MGVLSALRTGPAPSGSKLPFLYSVYILHAQYIWNIHGCQEGDGKFLKKRGTPGGDPSRPGGDGTERGNILEGEPPEGLTLLER